MSPTSTSTRWRRSRSGRWRCTTRGTRRTPGCARSTPTTTCSSTRRRRARRASPTATGSGSNRSGAGCAAWRSHSEAVEPGTVWTWNAIGKAAGAWNLAPDANESRQGFLLNHLISDELPAAARQRRGSRTPTRSPARPAGTTCACASSRPTPGEAQRSAAAVRADAAVPGHGRARRAAGVARTRDGRAAERSQMSHASSPW